MIKVSYNPRTARTLYNEKYAFGVKHDTEQRAEQSRIFRHNMGQNIARKALDLKRCHILSVPPLKFGERINENRQITNKTECVCKCPMC